MDDRALGSEETRITEAEPVLDLIQEAGANIGAADGPEGKAPGAASQSTRMHGFSGKKVDPGSPLRAVRDDAFPDIEERH